MSQSWVINKKVKGQVWFLYGSKAQNWSDLVKNGLKIFVSEYTTKTEYLGQHHILHYHSNKEKYMELYQCQCDLIGTKTVLLCYHDNKATDVVKTFVLFCFLTECYKTNNTSLSFDPCTTIDLEYLTNATTTGPDKFFCDYSHICLQENTKISFIRVCSRLYRVNVIKPPTNGVLTLLHHLVILWLC